MADHPTRPDVDDDRPDLAAMTLPLTRSLMAIERPVLAEHDLSMWGYGVLLRLDERPLRTQAALADAIGADKSRIIVVLDELQRRGLIERRPDPADRRVRLLSLTDAGRRVRDACRAGIRRREEVLLARLPQGDRQGFVRALRTLSALSAEELLAPPAPIDGSP